MHAHPRDRSPGAAAAGAGPDQHLHPPQPAPRLRAPAVRRGGRTRRRAVGARAVPRRVARIATSWRRAAFWPETSRRCSANSSGVRGAARCGGRRLPPRVSGGPIVLHGIPAATGRELSWILEETGGGLRTVQRRLWDACRGAVGRAGARPLPRRPFRSGTRDWLRAAYGIDTDAWIHPPLIRFLAGYLDQGLAHWPMPERNRGIHGCFLELYRTPLAAQCGAWARTLPRLVADDHDAGRNALDSIAHSLAELGVVEDECEDYLSAELLALRGWAGIVRQIEERPDRVPGARPHGDAARIPRGAPAVRTRGARARGATDAAFDGPLSDLRPWLREPAARLDAADSDRARVAALSRGAAVRPRCVDRGTVDRSRTSRSSRPNCTSSTDCASAGSCIRRSSARFVIACTTRSSVTRHEPSGGRRRSRRSSASTSGRNRSVAIWRKSTPDCETFSTAGFFNVAMYHQGVTDAHPRPLCPVAIRPDHYVAEIEPDGRSLRGDVRAACNGAPPGSSATTCIWAAGCRSAAPC